MHSQKKIFGELYVTPHFKLDQLLAADVPAIRGDDEDARSKDVEVNEQTREDGHDTSQQFSRDQGNYKVGGTAREAPSLPTIDRLVRWSAACVIDTQVKLDTWTAREAQSLPTTARLVRWSAACVLDTQVGLDTALKKWQSEQLEEEREQLLLDESSKLSDKVKRLRGRNLPEICFGEPKQTNPVEMKNAEVWAAIARKSESTPMTSEKRTRGR